MFVARLVVASKHGWIRISGGNCVRLASDEEISFANAAAEGSADAVDRLPPTCLTGYAWLPIDVYTRSTGDTNSGTDLFNTGGGVFGEERGEGAGDDGAASELTHADVWGTAERKTRGAECDEAAPPALRPFAARCAWPALCSPTSAHARHAVVCSRCVAPALCRRAPAPVWLQRRGAGGAASESRL